MSTAAVRQPVPRGAEELRDDWPVIVAALLGVMVSFASVFIYTFSVFLKPLAAEFGWSRAQVSAGFSIAALTVAFTSPIIGRVADRTGVRRVIASTSVLFGLSFASLAFLTPHLWHFYLAMFLMGLIANGTTQLPWARALTSRFDAARGLALSLMMVGGGLGSMLAPAVATQLTAALGWRNAYLILGIGVSVVGPLLALVGLRREEGVSRTLPRGSSTGAGSALRSRTFLTLVGAFFLVSLGANGCIAHLVPLLTDRGLSAGSAAAVASLLGLSSVAGRLVTGLLIDRFFAPRIGFLFVAASALGLFALAASTEISLVYAAVVALGLAVGAEADFFPFLISRYMGLGAFTELYGYAFSAYAVAGATGPILMGAVQDRFGTYSAALAIGACATLLAGALLLSLPRYRESPARG